MLSTFVYPHLLADVSAVHFNQWAALGILFLIAAIFSIFTLVMSSAIGPRRKGEIKDAPYESGVNPLGDTKQRFNVRFYLVAMIFLVFDVDVLFLIPWITIFPEHKALGISGLFLLSSMLVFILILMISYTYAWGKGVLRWD